MLFLESMHPYWSCYSDLERYQGFDYEDVEPRDSAMLRFYQLRDDLLCEERTPDRHYMDRILIILYDLKDSFPQCNTVMLSMHIREELIEEITTRCAVPFMRSALPEMQWLNRFMQLTTKLCTVAPRLWDDHLFAQVQQQALQANIALWDRHTELLLAFAMGSHRRLGSGPLKELDNRAFQTVFSNLCFFRVHPQIMRRGLKELVDTHPLFQWMESKPFFWWARINVPVMARYRRVKRPE